MIQEYLFILRCGEESTEAYCDYRYEGSGEEFVELKNPLSSNGFPYRFGYGADSDVLANPAIKAALVTGQYVLH